MPKQPQQHTTTSTTTSTTSTSPSGRVGARQRGAGDARPSVWVNLASRLFRVDLPTAAFCRPGQLVQLRFQLPPAKRERMVPLRRGKGRIAVPVPEGATRGADQHRQLVAGLEASPPEATPDVTAGRVTATAPPRRCTCTATRGPTSA